MGYTLHYFDDLINVQLKSQNRKLTKQQIEEIIKQAEKEKTRVIKIFKFDYIQTLTPSEIEKKVKYHQINLYTLTNTLYEYQTANTKEFELYHALQIIILQINDFLSVYFEIYFDFSMKLPFYTYNEVSKNLKSILDLILGTLTERDINPDFLKTIAEIHNYLDKRPIRLTYRLTTYFKELFESIIQAIETTNDNIENKIIRIFYDFGFNDSVLCNYLTNKITRELNAIESINEKIFHLHTRLKEIRQFIISKPHMILNIGITPINKSIETWLIEDLEYHKHSNVPLLTMPPTGQSTKKIKLNLSTSELSFFLKHFFATDMFQQQNFKQLCDHIAKYFMDHNSKPYNPESLRTKFSSVSTASIDKVKTILISMLNGINRYS